MLQPPENLLNPYPRRRSSMFGGSSGWFDLDDWVGPSHPSGRADVAKIEAILANSGDFPMEHFQGPTGYWGGALDAGIRAYQKRNGLDVDGALRPGGPTISHMRDSFAGLFDGYEPPTVDEIDAHQNAVGDDNDGSIVWRKLSVDLSQVPGLPEIDHEADASNARLAQAMLRTGNIDGYAQLMRDAIKLGGKHAVAEIDDLTKKLDEASPGLGGRFASSVVGPMSQEQLDALEIKRPEGQPPGTKVALGPAAIPLWQLGSAVLGLGTGIAGAYAIDETAKTLGKLPGRTPADNENKPAQPPPPALLDVPIHTGNPTLEPAKPIVLPNIPPATEEQQKIFDGAFGKAVDSVFPQIVYEDGRVDNRGTDATITGNNEIAKACKARAGVSPLAGLIKHIGGASKDGDGKQYLEEKTIKTGEVSDSPFRRSDIAYGIEKDGNLVVETHINSATTRADGSLITREVTPIKDIARKLGEKVIRSIRKFKDGDDKDEYYNEAYKICDEAMTEMEKEYEQKFGGPR
ncbi:MAG: peptidoglycan-binding protein [Rhodospirillales bacterium]|nr:peptidoglycan-binding protein [Rhodospirillales bacterium]